MYDAFTHVRQDRLRSLICIHGATDEEGERAEVRTSDAYKRGAILEVRVKPHESIETYHQILEHLSFVHLCEQHLEQLPVRLRHPAWWNQYTECSVLHLEEASEASG